MSKWYLIDDCVTKKLERYEVPLEATTEAEAISEAVKIYNHLSDHDKKLRDEFYIAMFDLLDNGDLDYTSEYGTIDIVEYVASKNMTNLKQYRIMRGLTQLDLATRTGISLRTLQDYEQGRKDINKAAAITVCKLAEELECNVWELLEEES